MKIGIYVGSFNPVHKGHIKIVNHLLEKYLDKVVIVPTGAYWDKNDLIDIKDRLNMLKFFASDRIIIEEEKNDLPYTYLVMEHFKEKYSNDELHLIIGADNIVSFDKWKNYNELLEGNLIVINRNGIDVKYYLDKLDKKEKVIVTEELDNIDISSTNIRNLIEKKDFETIGKMIDGKVLNYIISNKLFV